MLSCGNLSRAGRGCLPHCVWRLRSRFFPPTLESKAPSSTIERWWGGWLCRLSRELCIFYLIPGISTFFFFFSWSQGHLDFQCFLSPGLLSSANLPGFFNANRPCSASFPTHSYNPKLTFPLQLSPLNQPALTLLSRIYCVNLFLSSCL